MVKPADEPRTLENPGSYTGHSFPVCSFTDSEYREDTHDLSKSPETKLPWASGSTDI